MLLFVNEWKQKKLNPLGIYIFWGQIMMTGQVQAGQIRFSQGHERRWTREWFWMCAMY